MNNEIIRLYELIEQLQDKLADAVHRIDVLEFRLVPDIPISSQMPVVTPEPCRMCGIPYGVRMARQNPCDYSGCPNPC